MALLGYEYIDRLRNLEKWVKETEVDSSLDHITYAEAALKFDLEIRDVVNMIEDSEVLSEVVAVAVNGGMFEFTRESNYGIEYCGD